MNHTLSSGITLAGLACLIPTGGNAQEFIAGPPINCTITRPRPVVSTQLQTRQVTTFCDVTETQMTHRQVVENVPVTTCKNVTADEGGYQMVWVPKPVTRQVAQTTIQQQVKTVAVPVQVTRRVPQISTQVVPVQSVQYVNETVPLHMTAMASTCNTCGNGQAFGSSFMAPQLGFVPAPYPMVPGSTAMIPSMPPITVSPYKSALTPIPNPQVVIRGNGRRSPPGQRRRPTKRCPLAVSRHLQNETIAPPRKTSKFSGESFSRQPSGRRKRAQLAMKIGRGICVTSEMGRRNPALISCREIRANFEKTRP